MQCKNAAMTAEQQGSRLQQVRLCSNTTAMDTEIREKKKSYSPSEDLRNTGISTKVLSLSLPAFK